MPKGFVYVLTNPTMPGLAKVGFTTRMPTERAEELSTTGVPQMFVVEYYCLVDDPATLEARAHRALESSRLAADREFFRLEASAAIEAIDRLAAGAEHRWYRVPRHKPRPAQVKCEGCGAKYVSATHCPKCRLRLIW